MRTVLALVVLLAAPWPHATAAVYKCKNEQGATVYSEKPCGKDAAEVKVRNFEPTVDSSGNFKAMQSNNEKAGIARDEEWCVRNANDRIYLPLKSRIASINAEIAKLENATLYATNDVAGATFAGGLRQQVAGLIQSRSTELAAADSQMSAERSRCAQERNRRDDEFRRREEAEQQAQQQAQQPSQ